MRACVLSHFNHVWLCDPMDCSPPGSSVHGILRARILEWVTMPPPGDLPNPGIEPMSLMSPALAGSFFTTAPLGEPTIQWTLAIWSLVPLPFLNPACTFERSLFMNCWILANMWNEHNSMAIWTFFSITLLWDWNKNWLFQSCGHSWAFQICWHTECCTLTALSFRIWKSLVVIPSPPSPS